MSNPWKNVTKIGERAYRIELWAMDFIPAAGMLVTVGPRIDGLHICVLVQ